MPIQFDPTTRRALEQLIRKNLPDCTPDDRCLTGVALALHVCGEGAVDLSTYQAELDRLQGALNLSLTAQNEVRVPTRPLTAAGDGIRYYDAEARHVRKDPPGYDDFVGHLQMVRVTLPEETPTNFDTEYGTVEPQDHLLATLKEARQEYGHALPYEINRLDLVTPARFWGTRFGAISVYLGYEEPAQEPTFYILEGGTATGEARVTYFADKMDDVIYNYAGYKPTPFSSPVNAYTGTLSLSGDRPRRLTVASRQLNKLRPYMHLIVDFKERDVPAAVVWPGFNIMRAALIVLARRSRGDIRDA